MKDLSSIVKTLSDDELQRLIPTLNDSEYEQLKASLTQESTKLPAKPADLKTKVIEGVKGVGSGIDEALSQFSYGAQKTMGLGNFGEEFPQPKTGVHDIANLAGKGAGFLTGVPEVRLAEKTLAPAISEGARIISRTKPVQVASNIAKQGLDKFGNVVKEGALFTANILNSVPEEYLRKALESELSGKSILKKPFSRMEYEEAGKKAQKAIRYLNVFLDNPKIYNEIGKNIQDAMNYALKTKGQAVGIEKQAIRTSGDTVDTKTFVSFIDSQLKKHIYDNITDLTPSDMKHIDLIKNQLEKGLKAEKSTVGIVDQYGKPLIISPKKQPLAERLLAIKKNIENITGYPQEHVKAASDQGKAILSGLNNQIRDFLFKKYPDLQKTNIQFAKIAGVRDQTFSKLKNLNIQNTIKNFDKQSENVKALLTELNDALPKDMQFLGKINKAMENKALAQQFKGLIQDTRTLRSYASKNFDKKELLKRLDELAPDRFKFDKDVQNAVVRDALSQIFPGRGGGSGSSEGVANLLRTIIAGGTSGATLPLYSPLIAGKAIRGVGKTKELGTMAYKKMPNVNMPKARTVPYLLNQKDENGNY